MTDKLKGLRDGGPVEITMKAATPEQQATLDALLNGTGSGKPSGILERLPPVPAPAEKPQTHPLLDSIRVAVLAAKAKRQGIRHLTLCPRDWKVCLPYLTPGTAPGSAMIGPLLVKHGPNAKASMLWVAARDGQLGNMLAVPLSPWFAE